MDYTNRYYMVIEYDVERIPGHPARVRGLFSTVDDKTLWLGTSETNTQSNYLMNSNIVHRYGMPRHEGDVDAYLDDYIKRFPPLPTLLETVAVKDVDGWLSPGGDFYACPFMGHTALALDLAAAFYDHSEIARGAEDVLYKNGWVMVAHGNTLHASYMYGVEPIKMTGAQETFLIRLIDLNQGFQNYVEGIKRCLDRAGIKLATPVPSSQ